MPTEKPAVNPQKAIKRATNTAKPPGEPTKAKDAKPLQKPTGEKQQQNGISANAKGAEVKKQNEKNAAPAKAEPKIGIKRKIVPIAGPNETAAKRRAPTAAKPQISANVKSSPNEVKKPVKLEVVKKEEKPAASPARPANNNNGFNPLDNILNEIEAFDTSNKKPAKQKKRREKPIKIETLSDIGDGGTAPSTSQQLPPTPLPGTFRPLNRVELSKQEQDNTMVQQFLHRDDLMERILAYRMLRGRVDSYLTMKSRIDLNSCVVPQYEIRPDLVDPVVAQLHPKLEPSTKEEPPPPYDHPWAHTPQSSGNMRGPMTPPGSPGTNRSSTAAEGHGQHGFGHGMHELGEQPSTSGLPPPPKQPKIELESSGEEMLKKFGALLGVPEQRIRAFLGDDLQKLGTLKAEDLLETFRESLKHLAEKKSGAAKSPSTSNMAMASSAAAQPIKEEPTQTHSSSIAFSPAEQQRRNFLLFDQLQQQQNVLPTAVSQTDHLLEAAMEISSDSSSSTSSGVFLPPPPAPPPLLLGGKCGEEQPPPPPPPPLQEDEQHHQSAIVDPPPPPPPIPPAPLDLDVSNRSEATTTRQSMSSRAVQPSAGGSSRTLQRRGSGGGQQRRFSNGRRRSELNQQRRSGNSNNRRMRNLRDHDHHGRTARTPIGEAMGGSTNRTQPPRPPPEAGMTAACAKPISLLSLNLFGPPQSGTTPSSAAEQPQASAPPPTIPSSTGSNFEPIGVGKVPKFAAQSQLKQPKMEQQIPSSSSSTPAGCVGPPVGQPPPIVLNMEFIKNTPPPFIPEFIKNTPPPPIPEFMKQKALPNRTTNSPAIVPPHPPPPLHLPPPPLPMPMQGSTSSTTAVAMPPPPHPPKLLQMDLRMGIPPPIPTIRPRQMRPPLPMFRPTPPGPSPSSVLKTVVQAIGGKPPTGKETGTSSTGGSATDSPYGKFF